jgi:hypothetical protein
MVEKNSKEDSTQISYYHGEIFSRISVISDTLEEWGKGNYESFRRRWGELIAEKPPKNSKIENFLREFYETTLIDYGEFVLEMIPKKTIGIVEFSSVEAEIKDLIEKLRFEHPQIKLLVGFEKNINKLYKSVNEKIRIITEGKKERKKDFWVNIAVNIIFLIVGFVLGILGGFLLKYI